MTRARVFIAVEDVYAVRAISDLLHRRGLSLENIVVAHLPPCSSKMQRVINAHAARGSRIIVIVDAENLPSEEVERRVREKHSPVNTRIEVIAVDPCMEAIACEALGLKNCRVKPCSRGPLSSVNEYWRRRHGRDYEKRFLPRLFADAGVGGAQGAGG